MLESATPLPHPAVFHAPLHRAAARHALRAVRAAQGPGRTEGPAALRRARHRNHRRRAGGRREVRQPGHPAAQPGRRPRGLHHPWRRRGDRPDRLQGCLCAVRRQRLAVGGLRPGFRRAGPADDRQQPPVRDVELGQPGLADVRRPLAQRLRMPGGLRHAGAETGLFDEDRVGRMDRHHVPDRTALRHRPWHPQDEGRGQRRRQLRAERHQDLHQRRRARPRREHPAPRARAPSGRARGHPGHLAVPGAEVPAGCGRKARQAQRRQGRLDRTQDGHPRQRHLRDQPGRRHRLAKRTRAWRRCS
jgi:hypothetical protein